MQWESRADGRKQTMAVAVAAPQQRVMCREINFYDEYIPGDNQVDTFVDTFVDPVELVLVSQGVPTGKVARAKVDFKRAVDYLLMTPITNRKPDEIRKFVTKIHIDSDKFDPKFLIATFHENDKEMLIKCSKALDASIYRPQYHKETLLRVNFMKLCDV